VKAVKKAVLSFKEAVKWLRLFFREEFITLAKKCDFIQVFERKGDLVIYIGRYKHNPHNLARDCIKALKELVPEGIISEDGRRWTLLINAPEGGGDGEQEA